MTLLSELAPYFEAARALSGWQLEFEPEPLEPGPPWSYESIARTQLVNARRVLDLGTGGGEILEGLLRQTRRPCVATENWEVNAPVAAGRLAGLAEIVRCSSLAVPFRSGAFDLVLSRHEEFDPAEVARLLRAGGHFVTQQVISDVWPELRPIFPAMTRFPEHFTAYQEGLVNEGLLIEEARMFPLCVRYREVGHLVYHLAAAAPWMLPGFSLETHEEELAALGAWAEREDGIVLTEGFYLLQARSGVD